MFNFNKDSVVVQTWVEAVQKGDKKIEEIPNLFNLVDVVTGIVEGGAENV